MRRVGRSFFKKNRVRVYFRSYESVRNRILLPLTSDRGLTWRVSRDLTRSGVCLLEVLRRAYLVKFRIYGSLAAPSLFRVFGKKKRKRIVNDCRKHDAIYVDRVRMQKLDGRIHLDEGAWHDNSIILFSLFYFEYLETRG